MSEGCGRPDCEQCGFVPCEKHRTEKPEGLQPERIDLTITAEELDGIVLAAHSLRLRQGEHASDPAGDVEVAAFYGSIAGKLEVVAIRAGAMRCHAPDCIRPAVSRFGYCGPHAQRPDVPVPSD